MRRQGPSINWTAEIGKQGERLRIIPKIFNNGALLANYIVINKKNFFIIKLDLIPHALINNQRTL